MRPWCRRHHRRRRRIGLGKRLERAPTGEGGVGGTWAAESLALASADVLSPPLPPSSGSAMGGMHAVTTRSGGLAPWRRRRRGDIGGVATFEQARGSRAPTGPMKHSALDVTELARSGWSMVAAERERAGVMARRSSLYRTGHVTASGVRLARGGGRCSGRSGARCRDDR